MVWQIEYKKRAKKQFEKLPIKAQKKIDFYLKNRIANLDDPRQLGKPLTGNGIGLWRYRVGNYRIACEIKNSLLLIVVIEVGDRQYINY